jgi:hypothetical protein
LWYNWKQRTLRSMLVAPFILLVVIFPITLVTSAVGRLEYVLCPQNEVNPRWVGTALGGMTENSEAFCLVTADRRAISHCSPGQ